ncbi:hypothetical protein MTY66_10580 [Mycolicibacterium sp. TY66]|nr:hypothetical protein MTY66_10580 [Mycolicibacterium sp. TY66]BCJ82906.1 hypothetical protein MTY81_42790 [Mycolicibacterium sp. TY81]
MASESPSQPASRRDELLELAAAMFAERGLKATTVRDIADSAGILSGSRYQHFKSKEQFPAPNVSLCAKNLRFFAHKLTFDDALVVRTR